MTWFPKKKVIAPVDFSDESFAAVDVGLQLVDAPSDLTVVHVLPDLSPTEPGKMWGTIDKESRTRHAIKALRERLDDDKYKSVQIDILFGDAGHEIARLAERQGAEANLPAARTTAFCITAFAQLFYAVSCRSFRYTMPKLGFFTNPHLIGAIVISGLLQLSVVTLPFAQPFFEVATSSLGQTWILIVLLALTPVTVIELAKIAMKLSQRAGSHAT